MKKLSIILMIMILSVVSAVAQNGWMHFKGTVGPYEITLKLKESGGYHSNAMGRYVEEYSGSYTYVKAGNSLKLKGSWGMGFEKLYLTETTAKGKESAEWELSGDFDSVLTGKMIVTKTKKTFPVKLRRVR